MVKTINSSLVPSLLMVVVSSMFADDPGVTANLEGTWKSDWALTKKHIDAECKLTEEEVSGLERLMGKMTVRFSEKHVVFTMPDIRFKRDGKDQVIEGWTSKDDLNVIGRTKTQIAILSKARPPIGFDSITLINFEDADTYWVYLGHSPLPASMSANTSEGNHQAGPRTDRAEQRREPGAPIRLKLRASTLPRIGSILAFWNKPINDRTRDQEVFTLILHWAYLRKTLGTHGRRAL